MRRRSRKHLINACLFFSALSFVLYMNLSGSSNYLLAWTKIQYRTIAKILPESRGKCPGLDQTTKPALVVSRIRADDDPSWLDPLAKKYHFCIYTNDASSEGDHKSSTANGTLRVPQNRGHEAMSYLTFIIDNYATLPPAGAVFIHGARQAWHNDAPDYDNLALLRDLNVSRVLGTTGYHNLRCDWSAGTCDAVRSPGSFETKMTALLQPFDRRSVSDAALPLAFATLFGADEVAKSQMRVLLGNNEVLRAQCCAQFIVSRELIWQHSREEYIAIRQWLLDENVAPQDDRVAGRIISYLWHVLFLPQKGDVNIMDSGTGLVDLEKLNILACPSAQECYCRLYGRCDLRQCDSPGSCEGQYVLPSDYRVPEALMIHV